MWTQNKSVADNLLFIGARLPDPPIIGAGPRRVSPGTWPLTPPPCVDTQSKQLAAEVFLVWYQMPVKAHTSEQPVKVHTSEQPVISCYVILCCNLVRYPFENAKFLYIRTKKLAHSFVQTSGQTCHGMYT